MNDFALSYNLALSAIMVVKSMFFASLVVSPWIIVATMSLTTVGVGAYSVNKASCNIKKIEEQKSLLKLYEIKLHHKASSVTTQIKQKDENTLKYIRKGLSSSVNMLALTWIIGQWLLYLPMMTYFINTITPFIWPAITAASVIIGTSVGLAKRRSHNDTRNMSKRLTATLSSLETLSIVEEVRQPDHNDRQWSKTPTIRKPQVMIFNSRLKNDISHAHCLEAAPDIQVTATIA